LDLFLLAARVNRSEIIWGILILHNKSSPAARILVLMQSNYCLLFLPPNNSSSVRALEQKAVPLLMSGLEKAASRSMCGHIQSTGKNTESGGESISGQAGF